MPTGRERTVKVQKGTKKPYEQPKSNRKPHRVNRTANRDNQQKPQPTTDLAK